MKSLSLHPYRDEMLAARAAAESKPLPAPPAPPSGAAAAIALLKAESPAVPLVLAVRRPAAPVAPQPPAARPLPGIATIAYLSAVSVAIRVDQALHADTLRVIDDIRALLDGRPELLAPLADAVKAGCSL